MGTEANIEFKEALEKRRILLFAKGNRLVAKELQESKNDLKEARDRFNNKKYKYTTITAYYSAFHSARALIYSRGYREKSHYFLLVALKSLFVKKGLLEQDLVNRLHNAMILREEADYHGEFSKEGAESALELADEFICMSEKTIGEKTKNCENV